MIKPGDAQAAFVVGALELLIGEGKPDELREAYAQIGQYLELYIKQRYPRETRKHDSAPKSAT